MYIASVQHKYMNCIAYLTAAGLEKAHSDMTRCKPTLYLDSKSAIRQCCCVLPGIVIMESLSSTTNPVYTTITNTRISITISGILSLRSDGVDTKEKYGVLLMLQVHAYAALQQLRRQHKNLGISRNLEYE